jgi:hypothetical protein
MKIDALCQMYSFMIERTVVARYSEKPFAIDRFPFASAPLGSKAAVCGPFDLDQGLRCVCRAMSCTTTAAGEHGQN